MCVSVKLFEMKCKDLIMHIKQKDKEVMLLKNSINKPHGNYSQSQLIVVNAAMIEEFVQNEVLN